MHKKSRVLLGHAEVDYLPPPAFIPLPLAQWFETVHGNEVLAHLDEVKGVITSTYGRILKLDSTKKVHMMLTYQTYICIELWVYGYVSFIHH